jgi:predicted PurR-regulated permease PerM
MPSKIEISHKTIVFTILFLASLWLVFLIRDIIYAFFISMVITVTLNPLVTKLSRYKIPRAISVILVYLVLILIIGILVAGVIPPLVEQTTNFVNNFPNLLSRLGVSDGLSEQITNQVITQLASFPREVAKFTISVFSNFFALLTVFIFALYMLIEREKLDDQVAVWFGENRRDEVKKTMNLLETRLGGWARGQLMLMVAVGSSTFLGLTLLGVPFSLPLSLLAGLFEIVPFVGPIVAAIPAVLIGFSISPLIGFATIGLSVLVQQVENYILVPKIMQKSAGIDPVITLLSLAMGFRLAGVLGAMLSIPVVITVRTLGLQYFKSR